MNWIELAQKTKFLPLEQKTMLQTEYPDFSVWSWGTGRYCSVLGGIKSSFDGGEIILADYEYEHSRQMHAPVATGMRRGLTVCILKFSGLSLPAMSLRNEAPIQKIYKRVLGKHDINFPDDPDFSDHFELQGKEEDIRVLFGATVRDYFLGSFQNAPLRMEARDNCILVHFGVMLKPEDSRMLLLSAVDIANMWSSSPVGFEIPPDHFFFDK